MQRATTGISTGGITGEDLADIKRKGEAKDEAESKKENQGQVEDDVIRPRCRPLEIVQKEFRRQRYTIY